MFLILRSDWSFHVPLIPYSEDEINDLWSWLEQTHVEQPGPVDECSGCGRQQELIEGDLCQSCFDEGEDS